MKRGLKVYLGADHAGFSLKEKFKRFLKKKSIEFEDCGGSGKNGDDYPDYAFKVGKRVSGNKNSLGVLICGTGTGMVIAANKIKGIRAAAAYDSYSAKMAKHDNDVNVLCLRGRKFSESKNLKLVDSWLKEKFSNGERHKRRIRKIANAEGKK